MKLQSNINVTPLIDVFLVLIATILVVSGDINGSINKEAEIKNKQALEKYANEELKVTNQKEEILAKKNNLEMKIQEIKENIQKKRAKSEEDTKKIAVDLTPKTDKKQLSNELDKLKQELFNLRSAANNKVEFELYFSNSGKVYANEAETDFLTLLNLVPLGFHYNITMQSTANNSIAYQNFYKFCTHANSNGYKFKCQ